MPDCSLQFQSQIQPNCDPAAPSVAALVAYFRRLPSVWTNHLRNPANVKVLISKFQRRILNSDPALTGVFGDTVPFIWNGQMLDKTCMVDTDIELDTFCPTIEEFMFELPDEPESC